MTMKFYFFFIAIMISLCGCQRDIPKPKVEQNITVEPVSYIDINTDIPVIAEEEKEEFSVRHFIRGHNVYVECFLEGITFREQSGNHAKMFVYVNGKLKQEVHSAAFIVKGLPSGTHQMKLELVKSDHQKGNRLREFYVTIP